MAAATMYVTPAGALGKTGADWANAMGEAEFEADLEAGAEAGDIYYVLAGTYTLDSPYDSSARVGTVVAPISIIGVKAATSAEPPAYSDWPSVGSADRPTFACGANTVIFGNYYKLFNLIFTTSAAAAIQTGTYCTVVNSKFTQGSGLARSTLVLNTYSAAISCEFIGTSSEGIGLVGSNGSRAFFCYFHELGTGYRFGGYAEHALFNIFDTCSIIGLDVNSRAAGYAINNTFNDCATGIGITTGWAGGINNIFEGCTTDGVKATTAFNCGYWHRNHGDNARNTDMWDGIDEAIVAYMDNAVSTGDPLFDAANFNNSLQAGSPCQNNGLSAVLGT